MKKKPFQDHKGQAAEQTAYDYLVKNFDTVERFGATKDFFDFLVRKNGRETLVEVKYSNCAYQSAYVYFRWGQLANLFYAQQFKILGVTPKGLYWATPSEIFNTAHVHYNEQNPNNLSVYFRKSFINGKWQATEGDSCKFCHGTFQEWGLRHNRLFDVNSVCWFMREFTRTFTFQKNWDFTPLTAVKERKARREKARTVRLEMADADT